MSSMTCVLAAAYDFVALPRACSQRLFLDNNVACCFLHSRGLDLLHLTRHHDSNALQVAHRVLGE